MLLFSCFTVIRGEEIFPFTNQIYSNVSHLLQCGVRHSIAGNAEVGKLRVQVFEELYEGSVFGSAVRQDVGQLMSQVLHQAGVGDVTQDQGRNQ